MFQMMQQIFHFDDYWGVIVSGSTDTSMVGEVNKDSECERDSQGIAVKTDH
jgi:hypothetical protein